MSRPHLPPTAPNHVLRALRRRPDCTAFQWDGGALSGRGTADLIARMQAVLMRHGLGRGQRMALLAANRADAWCAGIAAQACAAAITPLHPRGSLVDHQAHLDDSQASMLVLDPHGFPQRAGELAALGGRTVFTLGPAEYGIDLLTAADAVGSAEVHDLSLGDDIAVLNYTGGTTGRAKGALRRHCDVLAGTQAILADFELPAVPRFLAVAPISHVAGSKVLPTLMRGGTVHLLAGFDPAHTLATLARERINMTLLVPTMIYTLLDHPALDGTDLSALELMLYGASPMAPARLLEGLQRIGPVFAQLYGQTECYPISFLARADHSAQRPELLASCGFACSNVDVALLDDAGQPVAPGEAGEICARAPQVMQHYLGQPELTAETFQHGWLHTGDVARQDDEGRLYIVDRKKDMIVSGGFNIYSREVEDVISAQPGVAQVAVFGVPDSKWGEAVTAFVVRQPGADVQAVALQREVRQRKGAAHAPKHIEFVDELPQTAVGKVDKKALRQRFWVGQDRQVG
ncbi:MAG: AMP-binding protein [Aquabacterium sp.]